MTPNLFAKIVDNKVLELIMPNETTQELPPAPKGPGWFAVQWPLPPSHTGERCIKEMLENRLPYRQPTSC